MPNVLINKSDFNVTVTKTGGRITNIEPITVRNQIREIRTIDDIPTVNNALKADGATIVWNANTGQYDIKLLADRPTLTVGNLFVSSVYANNSRGNPGEVLTTNGNTTYWADPAGVTDFDYYSGNNTFVIAAGESSVFTAAISVVNNFSITGTFLFNTIDGGSY
jgi:hypothetical protein